MNLYGVILSKDLTISRNFGKRISESISYFIVCRNQPSLHICSPTLVLYLAATRVAVLQTNFLLHRFTFHRVKQRTTLSRYCIKQLAKKHRCSLTSTYPTVNTGRRIMVENHCITKLFHIQRGSKVRFGEVLAVPHINKL